MIVGDDFGYEAILEIIPLVYIQGEGLPLSSTVSDAGMCFREKGIMNFECLPEKLILVLRYKVEIN